MPSTLEKLPSLLQLILQTTEETISTLHLTEKTGPSIKTRGGVFVLSYNFFSINTESDFQALITAIDSIIPKSETEVLVYSSMTGSITDQGQLGFRIEQAEIRDIYSFEEESFCYLRLLIEHSVDKKSRRWISLDVDFIPTSPWFMD